MKIVKTIIAIIVICALLVGMYFLVNKGVKYPENGVYARNEIEKVARPYIEKIAISMAIVSIYFMIRYNKLGIIKVLIISLIAMLATQAIVLAIYTVSKLTIDRMIFSALLLTFVATVLALTVKYEKNLKTT